MQAAVFDTELAALTTMNATTRIPLRRLHSGYAFNRLPHAPARETRDFGPGGKGSRAWGGRGGGKRRTEPTQARGGKGARQDGRIGGRASGWAGARRRHRGPPREARP